MVIPQDMLHLVINPTQDTLVTSNLVAETTIQDYEYVTKKHGAAYYELTDGRFIRNNSYENEYKLENFDAESRVLRNPSIEQSTENIYDLFLKKKQTNNLWPYPERTRN